MGKYFSTSTEEQSAPSSKVVICYKTKHQVSRSTASSEIFCRHVEWKHNLMHYLKARIQGISHEKTISR